MPLNAGKQSTRTAGCPPKQAQTTGWHSARTRQQQGLDEGWDDQVVGASQDLHLMPQEMLKVSKFLYSRHTHTHMAGGRQEPRSRHGVELRVRSAAAG